MKAENQLDGETPQQLVSEIQQLSVQYAREVTTARRTWPKSIRDRVLALHRLGLKCFRIARLTGIPEPTVSSWCKPRGRKPGTEKPQARFLPAVIQDSQTPAVGTPQSQVVGDLGVGAIVVSLPSGVTIRGLSVGQMIELCRGLQT